MDTEKKTQRTDDILKECDTRLTSEDVQDFLKSELVKATKKLYERAANGESLTISEVCDCRDYLTTLITIRTGTRPGLGLGSCSLAPRSFLMLSQAKTYHTKQYM